MTLTLPDVFEIYTTYYGWAVYDLFWLLFVVTGIILYPVLRLLWTYVQAIRGLPEPGDDEDGGQGDPGEAAVNSLLWAQIEALIVLILCVAPLSTLTIEELQVRTPCSEQPVAGDTESTFDDAFTKTFRGMDEVGIPPFWHLMLAAFSGAQYALTAQMPCIPNMLAVERTLRNVKLASPDTLPSSVDAEPQWSQDEGFASYNGGLCAGGEGYTCYAPDALLAEYTLFTEDCYNESMSLLEDSLNGRYGANQQQYMLSWMEQVQVGWREQGKRPDVEMNYPGNSLLADPDQGLYRPCRFRACPAIYRNPSAKRPVAGFDEPPACLEWWESLRTRLASQLVVMHLGEQALPAGRATEYLRAIQINEWLNDQDDLEGWVQRSGLSQQEMEDTVIKLFVQNLPAPVPAFREEAGWFEWIGSGVGRAAEAVGNVASDAATVVGYGAGAALSAKEIGGFYGGLHVYRQVAPFVKSLILMSVYALLLAYLVLAGYRFRAVFAATGVIAGLFLIGFLWKVARYVDSAMFVALQPNSESWGTFQGAVVDRAFFDLASSVLWIIAPLLVLYMLGLAGIRGVTGFGGALDAASARTTSIGAAAGRGAADVVSNVATRQRSSK